MFASRYFAPRYFAPRYWPSVGADGDTVDTSVTSTTYPYSQQASFTPIAGTGAIKYESIAWQTSQRLYDTTGFKGGTPECQSSYDFSPTVEDMIGSGWAYTTRYSFKQASLITLGSVTIQPSMWIIHKTWPLYEVSGIQPMSGKCDNNAAWGAGPPVYRLTVHGHVLKPSGPGLREKHVSTVITAEGIGSISWDSDTHVEIFKAKNDFSSGGLPQAVFQGRVEGKCSITDYPTDGNDFRWLLQTQGVTDNPVRGLFSLDTNAETVSANALMYDVAIKWEAADGGGHVTVNSKMRLDN